MRFLRHFWDWLSNVGAAYTSQRQSLKLLRLTNRVGFFSTITVLLSAVSFARGELWYFVAFNCVISLAYVSVLIFNAFGKLLVSRIWFIAVALGTITHNHFYFGFSAGFWILYLNIIQAPFILTPDLGRKKNLLLSLTILIGIVATLLLTQNLPALHTSVSAQQTAIFLRGNLIRGAILFALTAFYFVYETQIAEEELILSAKKATEAAEAKSFFVSNMSHELRTPMNAIKGFSEILLEVAAQVKDEKLQAKISEYLEQINLSASNLTSIIDDILDFARLETNRIVIRPKDFDLYALCQNVMQTARFHGHKNSAVQMRAEFSEDLPRRIHGDETRLSQVLLNLLSNATKFTHQGSVTLRATVKDQRPGAWLISFEVEDTGIGIPAAKLPYLFESFSSVSRETAVRYGGTGLGLAISRHLIEKQGGQISVMSSPGKGSIFSFALWYEHAQAAQPENATEKRDLRRARILVAEDNEVNQMVISAILDGWNAEVELVENGLKALSRAQAASYDAILMDIQMPFMDGIAAAENIRALDDRKHAAVPIIALTADVLGETRKKALGVGMNDIVSKPVNQAQLYSVLSRVLGLAGHTE